MTNPNQQPNEPELATPAVLEQAPASPERKGFFNTIRNLGAQAVEQVVELTPGALAKAEEIIDKTKDEIEKRVPEALGQVEKGAGAVADKAVESYGAVSTPATEFAKKAYREVIEPIGGDVLTAVGEEYGIEYEDKLKIRPIKLGRGVLRAVGNPVGALTKAARIATKTTKRSTVKMLVT